MWEVFGGQKTKKDERPKRGMQKNGKRMALRSEVRLFVVVPLLFLELAVIMQSSISFAPPLLVWYLPPQSQFFLFPSSPISHGHSLLSHTPTYLFSDSPLPLPLCYPPTSSSPSSFLFLLVRPNPISSTLPLFLLVLSLLTPASSPFFIPPASP